MIQFTIAILQLSSPFILIGLLLFWIYGISADLKRTTKNMENIRDDHESVYRRLNHIEDNIHKNLREIENHLEATDDVIEYMLDNVEVAPSGNKTKSKAK